jgi:hypothetical protein
MVLDGEATSPAGTSVRPVHPFSKKIIPMSGPTKPKVYRNNSVLPRARTELTA